MFGEFNEATQLKTSLAKNSIKFNDFSGTNASASNSVFEAVRQTLHITICEKVCGQTRLTLEPVADFPLILNNLSSWNSSIFASGF